MFGNRQKIQKQLERLYPGENGSRKYREYRQRQKKLAVIVLLLGVGAGICSNLWEYREDAVLQEGALLRNEWGEGSYEVTITAAVGETEESITYVVEERQYTDEELTLLWEQALEDLPKKIKGSNESLSCVRSNLNLPTQLEAYPFTITWRSSDYEKLRTDGTVNTNEVSKGGEEVTLTATLSGQGKSRQQKFVVTLYPEVLSLQEKQSRQLQEMIIKRDELSQQKQQIVLPEKLGEEPIVWQEQKDREGSRIVLLGLAAAGALIVGMNRDLEKRDKERQKELLIHYPEFVSSLQLYLGAGLSLRNAFFRIGNDYQRRKQGGGSRQFLYEEVVIACNQLTNGVSEVEVYRKWAQRCDEVHYRKLGYLLVSYSRQGNADLLRLLGKEVCAAWEERRNQTRKQGEEAGTRLLFPMIVMLMVVMFLIMVPVYVSL